MQVVSGKLSWFVGKNSSKEPYPRRARESNE